MSSNRCQYIFHKTIDYSAPVLRNLQIYELDALRVQPLEEKVLARNCTLGICIRLRRQNLLNDARKIYGIGLVLVRKCFVSAFPRLPSHDSGTKTGSPISEENVFCLKKFRYTLLSPCMNRRK